jgi:glyoxylase-like metal-dependent hydrolase (beta-lactamase superfamily II)
MMADGITPLGHGITCLDANYVEPGIACFYLIESDGQYALIETGTSHSVPGLLDYLDSAGIAREQVRHVIPTHVHLDHAGGVGAMMAAFPDASLLIHPRGARHMAQPERLVQSAKLVYGEQAFRELYGEITPVDASRIREVADGERIALGTRALEFRHTRGHANHHMCVWDERSRGWFTGDMFGVSYTWFRFAGGDFVLPSTTPTQFDPGTYLESLDLLAGYSPRAMYLTHFGELAYTKQASELLQRQVSRFCELATELGDDPDALEQALAGYAQDLLRDFAPDTDADTLRRWAAFDVPLNTQGLLHWRSSRVGGD